MQTLFDALLFHYCSLGNYIVITTNIRDPQSPPTFIIMQQDVDAGNQVYQ